MRIVAFDEVDLPLTRPVLHRLLTLNHEEDVTEAFVPDKTVNAVFFTEAFEDTVLVLPCAADDV